MQEKRRRKHYVCHFSQDLLLITIYCTVKSKFKFMVEEMQNVT